MVYEITYKDEKGNPLLQATFNADGPKEAFNIILTTPSLAPPEGAADIDIRRLPVV